MNSSKKITLILSAIVCLQTGFVIAVTNYKIPRVQVSSTFAQDKKSKTTTIQNVNIVKPKAVSFTNCDVTIHVHAEKNAPSSLQVCRKSNKKPVDNLQSKIIEIKQPTESKPLSLFKRHGFNYVFTSSAIEATVLEFLGKDVAKKQAQSLYDSIQKNRLTDYKQASSMLNFYASNFRTFQDYNNFIKECSSPEKNNLLHLALAAHPSFNNLEYQTGYDTTKKLIVKRLIQEGVDVNAITNNNKINVMHFAAALAHANCITMLKKAGADIDVKSETGFAPLHCVIIPPYSKSSCETVEALVFCGVDINAKAIFKNYNKTQETTPLKYLSLDFNTSIPMSEEQKKLKDNLIKTVKNLGGYE